MNPLDRPIGRPHCAANTIAHTALLWLVIPTQLGAIYSTAVAPHSSGHVLEVGFSVMWPSSAISFILIAFIFDKKLQRGKFFWIKLFDNFFYYSIRLFYINFVIVLMVCIYQDSFGAIFSFMLPSYMYLFPIRYLKRAKAGCRRLDPSSTPDQWEADNIGLSVKHK